ncbi:hypothetical protein NP233_g2518 [Leucocoprinus birnbaumii]|uniref:Uncharacterized protein n=1 Tax=Leucocoprinus birnbaumii TaxID=56174 RepID=A0AAD5YTP5_9AGAR|nr:hypothetical protein NP233_g2518 [Leucocoprinus birnbaumii]
MHSLWMGLPLSSWNVSLIFGPVLEVPDRGDYIGEHENRQVSVELEGQDSGDLDEIEARMVRRPSGGGFGGLDFKPPLPAKPTLVHAPVEQAHHPELRRDLGHGQSPSTRPPFKLAITPTGRHTSVHLEPTPRTDRAATTALDQSPAHIFSAPTIFGR